MNKALPKTLTSHDLLKTLAILLMIIDHIGVYFFPEELWWRAAGRLSAPIWLFLIGYAKTREVPTKLWISALILFLSSFLISDAIFPINILIGIIITRLILDKVTNWFFADREHVVAGILAALLLMLPTYFLFEYGTLCIMLALYGYLQRWNETKKLLPKWASIAFILISATSYIFMAAISFEFDTEQKIIMALGVSIVFIMLYLFSPQNNLKLSKTLPKPITALLKITGRKTLEIYVVHLLLFKALAFYFGIEGFNLFEWQWF